MRLYNPTLPDQYSYRATRIVEYNRSLAELRVFACRVIPHLDWRRHGIGCLQAYLLEDTDMEIRLHIWHPDIVREGIRDNGDIHDHRFTMTSTVLHGSIRHTEYDVEDNSEGAWDVYQVLHARADIGARYQPVPVPGPLESKQRRVALKARTGVLHNGVTYEFERGHFHRTTIKDLAVTLVVKQNQIKTKAQIIARHGVPPIHAFEKDDDFDMVPYLGAAIEALGARL